MMVKRMGERKVVEGGGIKGGDDVEWGGGVRSREEGREGGG